CVEVDEAALDEADDRRRRERLRRRAAEEERALVHRQRVLDARHAVEDVLLPAVLEDADGDAGNPQLLGEGRDDLLQGAHVLQTTSIGRSRPGSGSARASASTASRAVRARRVHESMRTVWF